MVAAVSAGNIFPVIFGYFDFSGGAVRVSTSNHPIVWAGETWTGLGDFLGVSPMQETSGIRANGIVFTLSGVPSNLIAEVIANRSRGRVCSLWFGCFDGSGTLLADPVQIFAGRMDQPSISDQGETATVSLSAESRLADLQRNRERRFTDLDQKNLFPGDKGLAYIAALQEMEINWGVPYKNIGSGVGHREALYVD